MTTSTIGQAIDAVDALCRERGVERLLSEDRYLRRFPALTLVTPDVSPGVP